MFNLITKKKAFTTDDILQYHHFFVFTVFLQKIIWPSASLSASAPFTFGSICEKRSRTPETPKSGEVELHTAPENQKDANDYLGGYDDHDQGNLEMPSPPWQ